MGVTVGVLEFLAVFAYFGTSCAYFLVELQ